jgi:LAO/AO transport system kinase
MRALRAMLELGHPSHRAPSGSSTPLWIPPVLQTIATKAEGIHEVVEAIDAHARHLRETGVWQMRDRSRLLAELETLVQFELNAQWRATLLPEALVSTLEALENRQMSPYQAAKRLTSLQTEAVVH